MLVAEPVLRVAEGLPFLWGTLTVAAALLIGRYRGLSLVKQANSRPRRRGKTAGKTRDEQRKPITPVDPAANGPPGLTFRAPGILAKM